MGREGPPPFPGGETIRFDSFDEETIKDYYCKGNLICFYMRWENVELYFAYTGELHALKLCYHMPLENVQEAYRNPDSQGKAINAAAYRIIHDRIKEEKDLVWD